MSFVFVVLGVVTTVVANCFAWLWFGFHLISFKTSLGLSCAGDICMFSYAKSIHNAILGTIHKLGTLPGSECCCCRCCCYSCGGCGYLCYYCWPMTMTFAIKLPTLATSMGTSSCVTTCRPPYVCGYVCRYYTVLVASSYKHDINN